MKKFDGIKKRAEYVEWKSGKIYAKPDGSLYNFFNKLSYIAVFYTLIINTINIIGTPLHLAFDVVPNKKSTILFTIVVTVCSLLFVAYFVLSRLKFKLLPPILNIVASIPLVIIYATNMTMPATVKTLFGLPHSYYYRHFIPLVIILFASVFMVIIVVRSNLKFNKVYLETEETIYNLYKKHTPDCTEESWIEFAKNYDGTSPRKLFEKK